MFVNININVFKTKIQNIQYKFVSSPILRKQIVVWLLIFEIKVFMNSDFGFQ